MGEALITRRGGGGAKFVRGSYLIEESTQTFEVTDLPFEPTGFALVCDQIGGGMYYSGEYITADKQSPGYQAISYSGGSRRGQGANVTFGANSLTVVLQSYDFYTSTTMRYYIWGE